MFRTSDGGGSWSPKKSGLTDLNVFTIAIDPDHPKHLLAGTLTGVFETADSGSSWAPKNTGIAGSVQALAFDPSDTDVVYAGLDGGGVFVSTNGSDSWADFNTGLPTGVVRDIQDVAVSSDGSRVYVGTPGGVYRRDT